MDHHPIDGNSMFAIERTGEHHQGSLSPESHDALSLAVDEMSDAAATRLADMLLAMATEVEQDERRLKRALMSAAERGESARVASVIRAWIDRPAREVMKLVSDRAQDIDPRRER